MKYDRDEPRHSALAAPFAILGTSALSIIAYYSMQLSGAADAMLTWDSAAFLGQAIQMKRAIEVDGITGFAHSFAHTSQTHTPLVPMLSAIAMLLFGESRTVATGIFPVFLFIFLFSTVRAVEWVLYYWEKESAVLPFATAAIAATFPAALEQYKIYLFEFPLAAMSAWFFHAILATHHFTRTRYCILAGIVAGVAAVTRAGGPVLLVGPALVVWIAALRSGPRWPVLRNSATALLFAVGTALTWYGPNIGPLYKYIYSVTYGERAAIFTETGTSLSLKSMFGTFHWAILDGPGVPVTATAIVGFLIICFEARRFVLNRIVIAILAALLISLTLVAFASQKAGGVLGLAVMPLTACLVAAPAISIRNRAIRTFFSFCIAAFAAHHLVATSFLFPTDSRSPMGFGPFGGSFPFWNHRSTFISVAGGAGRREDAQGKMVALAEAVEGVVNRYAPIERPIVFLLTDDPFFNANNLALEGLRRRCNWWVQAAAWAPIDTARENIANYYNAMIHGDILIIPEGSDPAFASHREFVELLTKSLLHPDCPAFVDTGVRVPFAPDAQLGIFRRREDVEWIAAVTGATPRVEYASSVDSRRKIQVFDAAIERAGNQYWGVVTIGVSPALTSLPNINFLIHERATGEVISDAGLAPRSHARFAARPPGSSAARVRIQLNPGMPPRLPSRGFRLSLQILESVGGPQWARADRIVGERPNPNVIIASQDPVR